MSQQFMNQTLKPGCFFKARRKSWCLQYVANAIYSWNR